MRNLTKLAAAGAIALGLASFSAPAFADPLGSFAQIGTGANLQWLRVGSTGGHLFTGDGSDTTAQYQTISFSFNTPELATLTNLDATLWLDANETGHAATGSGINLVQSGLGGTLKVTYTGSNSSVLAYGTNLITFSFSNAWVLGGLSTASFNGFNDSTWPSTASFTSDFIDPTRFENPSFILTFNSTGVGHASGKSLSNFNASATGNFAADAIPEPASWALMIMGFGGVGAMLRNRRRVVTSFA
jgi:hypothetical protein